MFILAEKYSFVPNPEKCSLSAFVNSHTRETREVRWSLKAHSESSLVRFSPSGEDLPPPNQEDADLESTAFGIQCDGLSFDVHDWRELAGKSFACGAEVLVGGFMVVEWEDLSSLNLTFGKVRGKMLEVEAVGRGYVESASEYFGADQVEFCIRTWLKFTGVHAEVPINSPAPVVFAETQIKHILPKYEYTHPELIETKDDDRILGVGVSFPPRET